MKIQVLYFGELREAVNTHIETVEIDQEMPRVVHLIDYLAVRGEPWQSALKSPDPLRVAVNQEMGGLDTLLIDGAEVALFRPVTGG
jgi:molybdopterin converting factor subunit 1